MNQTFVIDTTRFINPTDVVNNSPPNYLRKYSGLIRYAGTPDLSWKNIDVSEQAIYNSADLSVAFVFERGGSTALLGRDEGRRNAEAMLKDLTKCNAKASSGYFVAQDIDYSNKVWKTAVAEYFHGLHDVCDQLQFVIGGYAGYEVIKFLFDEKLIKLGWQPKAWSHGFFDIRCALYQQTGYVYPGGVQSDWNIVYEPNWGQNNFRGDNFMTLNATEEQELLKAARQINGTAGPGQLNFSGTVESILGTVQGLVNLTRAGTNTLSNQLKDEKISVLAAITALPTVHLSDEDKIALAGEISKAVKLDPTTILDALKTRLEN